MNQIRWFERKFNFSGKQHIFPSIIERLTGTPLRLKHKLSDVNRPVLVTRVENTWSIQENVGHLIDLESLWQGRLEDILAGKMYLRETDLTNQQVDKADYNQYILSSLLARFDQLRKEIIDQLQLLTEEEIFQSALHPRLKTPMRTMDLFLFVAEHDDHHLARISQLQKYLS